MPSSSLPLSSRCPVWSSSKRRGSNRSECTACTSCQSLYTYAHPVCKCMLSRLTLTLSRSLSAFACLSVCASPFIGIRPEEIIVIRIDLASAMMSLGIDRQWRCRGSDNAPMQPANCWQRADNVSIQKSAAYSQLLDPVHVIYVRSHMHK